MFKKKCEVVPYEVRKQIEEWKREEGFDFEILYRYKRGKLEILTTKPGILIGYRGKSIYNLENKLKNIKGYRGHKITYIRHYT